VPFRPGVPLDNRRVITRHARALAMGLCGQNLPLWMGELVSDKPDGQLQDIGPVRDGLAADADRIAARIHEVFHLGLADDQLPWLTLEWARDRVTSWISDLDAVPVIMPASPRLP
jgi:hypothetical protein